MDFMGVMGTIGKVVLSALTFILSPILSPIKSLFSGIGTFFSGMFGSFLSENEGAGGGGILSGLFNTISSPDRTQAPAIGPTVQAGYTNVRNDFGAAAPRVESSDLAEPAVSHRYNGRDTGRFIDALSPDMKAYVMTLKGKEGSTKNALSSASGRYQFMDYTWPNLVRKYAKDYPDEDFHKFSDSKQTSHKDVMALKKYDDDFKDYIFIRMTQDNAASFKASTGQDATPAWLYMCHQQGAGMAAAMYKNPAGDMVDTANKVNGKPGADRFLAAGDMALYRKMTKEDKDKLCYGESCVLANGGHIGITNAQFYAKYAGKFAQDFSTPGGARNMALARNGGASSPQASV